MRNLRNQVLVLSLAALACNKAQNPADKTTTNANASTSAQAEVAKPVATESILSLVPASSCGAMAFQNPLQSVEKIKSLVMKTSPALLADPEFLKGIGEVKEETGIDLTNPESFKVMGLDFSKGVALSVDCDLSFRKDDTMDWINAVSTRREPAFIATLVVSDKNALLAFIKKTLEKEKGARIEEVSSGDVTLLKLFAQVQDLIELPVAEEAGSTLPAASTSTKTKDRLDAVLAIKGTTLYAFLNINAKQPQDPSMQDAIAIAESDIKEFLAKPITSIAAESVFASTLTQIDANADMKLLVNSSKIQSSLSKLSSTQYTYLTPKDDQQKTEQENEKKYQSERVTREAEEQQFIGKFLAAAPAMAFSASLASDKVSFAGSAAVGETARAALEKIFIPEANTPAYAGMLPESTAFFARYTMNPKATKDFIWTFLPEEPKLDADKGIAQMNQELAQVGGLDLERDILGAFTGNFTFSANSLEGLAQTVIAMERPEFKAPVGNQNFLVTAQTTSAEAADKLLAAIATGLEKSQAPAITEDIAGNKFYAMNKMPGFVTWGRIDNLLLLSFDVRNEASNSPKETLEGVVARSKTPGASFAEKLGSPLARELATGKAMSGITMDLGGLFAYLGSNEPNASSDAEFLRKASAVISRFTATGGMQNGAFTFKAELGLR